jgi:exodeoxyribonuclease VII small subunit
VFNFCFVPNAPEHPGRKVAPDATSLPFEEAMKKLEGIVEQMESGDLPLDQLLARFEEGTRLARICQDKLADAELKVQQLEKTASGELKLKPLSPVAPEDE